jgi:hypothetical protein
MNLSNDSGECFKLSDSRRMVGKLAARIAEMPLYKVKQTANTCNADSHKCVNPCVNVQCKIPPNYGITPPLIRAVVLRPFQFGLTPKIDLIAPIGLVKVCPSAVV